MGTLGGRWDKALEFKSCVFSSRGRPSQFFGHKSHGCWQLLGACDLWRRPTFVLFGLLLKMVFALGKSWGISEAISVKFDLKPWPGFRREIWWMQKGPPTKSSKRPLRNQRPNSDVNSKHVSADDNWWNWRLSMKYFWWWFIEIETIVFFDKFSRAWGSGRCCATPSAGPNSGVARRGRRWLGRRRSGRGTAWYSHDCGW